MTARANRTFSILTILSLAWVCPKMAAHAQPIDLESWSLVRTPNVTLLTDADAQRGAEVVATLERFRSVFAQLAPGLDLESPAPTHMIAFRDAESYAPYRRGGGRGVAVLGQFLTSADGNVLTLNVAPRFVGAFAVIYHEYVHYLVGSNLPDVPRWFNEGLAEYYSTFRIEGEHARIGRAVPRHQTWLRRHGIPSLPQLLATSGSAHRHGADEVGAFYAGSWLLVHYLLSGDGERLDHTAALLARLAAGDDATDALEEIFGVRVRELEKRLAAHLNAEEFPQARLPLSALDRFEVTVAPAGPAEVLVQLGDLSARLGELNAASAHFYEALAHAPQHPEAHAGLAWVRDLEGRFDEAEILYQDALALETRDPVVFLRWGRHLLRTLGTDVESSARAERARRAFERVTELDPSFAEGWAMHGVSHLAPGADPADGIASLERAVARLPARLDLVARLVSLEARAGHFARAQQRIERTLAKRVEPEVVDQAREEIDRWRLLRGAQAAFDEGRTDEGLRLFDQAVSVTSDPLARKELENRLRVLQETTGH